MDVQAAIAAVRAMPIVAILECARCRAKKYLYSEADCDLMKAWLTEHRCP